MKDRNAQHKKGEHPFGDAGQLILLCIFLVVWIGDSFFFRFSTFLSESVPLGVRLVLLCAALGCAFWLMKAGHVVVPHEHRLTSVVSSGAFRFVRHPLYLASMLTYLGLAVSTMSILCFVLLVPIFVFHNYIASYEERLLEEKFGEEYRRYKKRTRKWIFGIGKEHPVS